MQENKSLTASRNRLSLTLQITKFQNEMDNKNKIATSRAETYAFTAAGLGMLKIITHVYVRRYKIFKAVLLPLL